MEKLAEHFSFACPQACGFRGKPDALRTHKAECKLRLVKCPLKECEHRCSLKDLPLHIESELHKGDVHVFDYNRCKVKVSGTSETDFWSSEPQIPFLIKDPVRKTRCYLIRELKSDGVWIRGTACHFHESDRTTFTVCFSDVNSECSVSVKGYTAGIETADTENYAIHKDQLKMSNRVDAGEYGLKMTCSFEWDMLILND
ncbi:unnamed protein product [Polarella glacialis]|uniref:Uncharacterized protein n=1 Tax=Polarella glacialis TaxID=89957 RepID=A0A813JJ20_POLGL|nr:unnamed protein product [Polarella glacialis]